jgi:hypothetical protein
MGCKTGKSYGEASTPPTMPFEVVAPVFDLLRANRIET